MDAVQTQTVDHRRQELIAIALLIGICLLVLIGAVTVGMITQRPRFLFVAGMATLGCAIGAVKFVRRKGRGVS